MGSRISTLQHFRIDGICADRQADNSLSSASAFSVLEWRSLSGFPLKRTVPTMAWGLYFCGMLNGWDIAPTAKRMQRNMVDIVAGMRATHFRELMVILLVPGIALAQEVFSGGNGTAPTTYSDQF